jgi:hypothetical protein
MDNPDSKQKIQDLGTRVAAAKAKVDGEIRGWSKEERATFLDNFSEHPALLEVNSASDPAERVRKFLTLSDSDLEQMMKMQLIVAINMQEGGSLQDLLPPLKEGEREKQRDNEALDSFALQNFLGGGYGMNRQGGEG